MWAAAGRMNDAALSANAQKAAKFCSSTHADTTATGTTAETTVGVAAAFQANASVGRSKRSVRIAPAASGEC